jgi:hypothetical protein
MLSKSANRGVATRPASARAATPEPRPAGCSEHGEEDSNMATTHVRMPARIARLPEPARTKAVEMANALVRDGSTEEEAEERAVAMATQWVFERAPGDRSALDGDGETAPERPGTTDAARRLAGKA